MLQDIIEMASRNQVVVLTPFTLSGAMAPVTLAGALAQQNAEALAGLVFTQLVRPGGHFFGTEHTQQRYRSAFYQPMISDWRN